MQGGGGTGLHALAGRQPLKKILFLIWSIFNIVLTFESELHLNRKLPIESNRMELILDYYSI